MVFARREKAHGNSENPHGFVLLFLHLLAKALPESFINDKVYKGSANVFGVDRK